MLCLSCGCLEAPLCRRCRMVLRPGPERVVGAVPARAAFAHEGPARRLVHRLKYGGHTLVAQWAAPHLASCLPTGVECLVPVPRARSRVARHGIDAAAVLAEALSRHTRLPTARLLRAGWWWTKHSGRSGGRLPPRFRAGRLRAGAVLVDDVLTSGATLSGAIAASGPSVVGCLTLTGVE